MPASFDGASFREAGSTNFKRAAVRSRATIHEIAGGGYVVQVPRNAKPATTVSLKAQGTEAEIAALQGKVDVIGTLTWSGGSLGDMLLLEVGEPEEVKANGNVVQAACQWRYVGT